MMGVRLEHVEKLVVVGWDGGGMTYSTVCRRTWGGGWEWNQARTARCKAFIAAHVLPWRKACTENATISQSYSRPASSNQRLLLLPQGYNLRSCEQLLPVKSLVVQRSVAPTLTTTPLPSTTTSPRHTRMSNPGVRQDGSLDPEYNRRIQANFAPPDASRSLGGRPSQPHPSYNPAPYGQPFPPPPGYGQPFPPPPGYGQSYPHQQQPFPPLQQPYPSNQPNPYQPHQGYSPQPPPPPPPPGPPSSRLYQPPGPGGPFSGVPPPGGVMTSSFRPSGRKKALLVGINYRGTPAALRGCVRDVTFVHHLLVSKFNFKAKDFVVLTDESTGIPGVRKGPPTRKVILDSIKWLVDGSRAGDSLWFSFSGHGSQVRDTNGDESDGYDETILPVDYKRAGHIIDDELYAIVRRVARGARLTVLLDACHSGTGLDLPYQHDVFGTGSGQRVSGGRNNSLTSGLFNVAGALLNGNATSALSAGLNLAGVGRKKNKMPTGPDPNAGEVLLFSGCKDNQTSADTSKLAGGLTTGAMSYALIETLEHSTVGDWRNYTYRKLLQTMRQKLRNAKMTQIPQFSTSHPFDLSSRFML